MAPWYDLSGGGWKRIEDGSRRVLLWVWKRVEPANVVRARRDERGHQGHGQKDEIHGEFDFMRVWNESLEGYIDCD